MRQPLREKLQNAINRALLPDNDLGALIVGGRRRNRKKKVKNKNNGTKNKKNAKKTEGKSNKKYGGGFLGNKDDSGHESDPLIDEEAEAETWGDNHQVVQEDQAEEEEGETLKSGEEGEEDQENLDTDKMPLGLFKKKDKKDKKEKKDKKKDKNEAKTELVEAQDEASAVTEPGQEPQPVTFKEGTTLAAMASTVPKQPLPVREWEHEFDSPDGGYVPAPSNDTSKSAVQEKTDPEKPVDKDETELKKLEVNDGGVKDAGVKDAGVKDGAVKSENSPLILKDAEAKESKLQDQQPGMLCCTIL